MRQVDDLGAMYLAAENSRVTTHTAALVTVDPTALPDGRLTAGMVRAMVRDRLDLVPPFRWRLVTVPLGLDRPYWAEADVDLDFHIREIALPPPGDEAQLREQVARIFSRPLDRSRPLWEMYLIQGLAHGRAAVLTKIHHAAADGRTGAQILSILTDPVPHPHLQSAAEVVTSPPPSTAAMLVRGLVGLVRQPLRTWADLPGVLTGLEEQSIFGAPRTSFNCRVSQHRRIGIATMTLDDVKRVKNHFTVSVNDVVMAIAAGALRRWLLEHDELPADPLTAVVPVALRGSGPSTYGNRLSAVVVRIPTDEPEPDSRLNAAHQAMLAALRNLGTTAPDALADTIRLVSPMFVGVAAQLLTGLNAWAPLTPAMNVNISNVSGPSDQLYLAGARVESMVPLAGITDGLGLNITVMSYHGQITAGIVADRDQVPDVQRIADWMAEELAVLLKQVDD
jgi:WS/DGAT/MGAT family acyltransferase